MIDASIIKPDITDNLQAKLYSQDTKIVFS